MSDPQSTDNDALHTIKEQHGVLLVSDPQSTGSDTLSTIKEGRGVLVVSYPQPYPRICAAQIRTCKGKGLRISVLLRCTAKGKGYEYPHFCTVQIKV